MSKIKRKQTVGIIDDVIDNTELAYCLGCLKQGFVSLLGERIYLPGEPVASDHDQWKQCRECGQLIPIYEVYREGKLQDFVETTSNPFDIGKSIVGLNNKGKKNKYQKMREKRQEI